MKSAPPGAALSAARFVRCSADTARWTAQQRARETEREDALVRDDLAQLFVGARPPDAEGDHRIAVRTCVVDRMLLELTAHDFDTVVHLGAGFDTRPHRLALPRALRWVEVDVPEIVEEKARLLGDRPARCAVERRSADLSDGASRTSLLAPFGGPRTLVLCEGLLVYLDEDMVSALARELADLSVGAWLTDVASPLFVEAARAAASPGDVLSSLLRFAPAEGPRFFERHGWRQRTFVSLEREAERLGRARPFEGLPGELRELLLDAAGLALLVPSD